MTNAKNSIANKDKNSNTIFSDIKSWFRYLRSYFLNLLVKNKINKKIPPENQSGELLLKNIYKIVNDMDNIKIFKRWLNLFPINIEIIVSPSDSNKLKLKLRFVKLKPCKVANIFHIQTIIVRKIDDASKVIKKDLNFICLFSD